MDNKSKNIRHHWENWAEIYGQNIQATTRSAGIKKLEIQAIIDAIKKYYSQPPQLILEAGCGNGANCIALNQYFGSTLHGFDYIKKMVESAKEQDKTGSIYFTSGDVTDLESVDGLLEQYDLVFTCRCLINLPEKEQKEKAIVELASKVSKGGYLFLLENFTDSFELQNKYRNTLNMQDREVAEFNVFFEEQWLVDTLQKNGLLIAETVHFSGIHDLLQYILIPGAGTGEVDYESPITRALVDLQLENESFRNALNLTIGQNRLVVIRHV